MSTRFILITGKMGCGKSAVSDLLRKKSYTVLDTDSIVKEYYKEEHIQNIVRAQFGDNAINETGVDFNFLKENLFKSENIEKRNVIESALVGMFHTKLLFNKELNSYPVIFIEAALTESLPSLIEDLHITDIIMVGCNENIRHERLLNRGMSEKDIEIRSALQQWIKPKTDINRYDINNDGNLSDLLDSVNTLLSGNLLSKEEKYEHFKKFLDSAPDYCKTNTWCYAFYNSRGCGDCPFPCDRQEKRFIEIKKTSITHRLKTGGFEGTPLNP